MTNPPTTTQQWLLLDANVVIEAHRAEVWEHLLERGSLAVPSVVAHTEALFYEAELGAVPKPIRLPALIQHGSLLELSATADELQALRKLFDRVFLEGLHAGEMEALALLLGGRCALEVCSGDKMAIQALAMMDRAGDCISLEGVLRRMGLKKSLNLEFTEAYHLRHLAIGCEKRIRREGLR